MVVAGRSKNVGMPIATLLHTDGEHERPGGERPAGLRGSSSRQEKTPDGVCGSAHSWCESLESTKRNF